MVSLSLVEVAQHWAGDTTPDDENNWRGHDLIGRCTVWVEFDNQGTSFTLVTVSWNIWSRVFFCFIKRI